MQINLVEEIVDLTRAVDISQINIDVYRYFLTRNLEKMFGKCLFDENEMEIVRAVDENKNRKLIVLIGGEKYVTEFNLENGLIFKAAKNSNGFSISSKNLVMQSKLVNFESNNEIITENLAVSMVPNDEFYDYQKSVVAPDGNKVDYPLYRLKSINSKVKSKAIYELIDLNKNEKGEVKRSFLQKIVDNFNSNQLFTINIGEEFEASKYLDQVYEILESKTNSLEATRK